MFKIYTSYINNRRLKNKDAMFIPICNRIYVWNGYSDHYSELAPDMKEVERLHDALKVTSEMKEHFTKKYLEKLDRLREDGTLDKYVKDLQIRLQYDDIFLLCYETPKKFCHRHILANYLNNYYGLDISEF